MRKFEPDWASAPFDTVMDIVQDKSIADLCTKLNLTSDELKMYVNGEKEIDPNMAQKLEAHVGVTEEFWLTRERQYREDLVRISLPKIEEFQNNNIEIRKISEIEALEVVFRNHYSKIMPRLTTHYLGGFIDDKLIGVLTLGYGTRPLHTIKKLFPSLSTKDYFEIGKMCMEDRMPKNTESAFLSKVIHWIKVNEPSRKILFTWADGILGKIGSVYQAANFLYGGYIWTDLYISADGEKIHPRTSQGITAKDDGVEVGRRPDLEFLRENKWDHYRGKQFRYIYFTCNKREKKALLKESVENWALEYPKKGALEWKIQDTETGDWSEIDSISYNADNSNKFNKSFKKNNRLVSTFVRSKQFWE